VVGNVAGMGSAEIPGFVLFYILITCIGLILLFYKIRLKLKN
jgi:hypothetical protein